MKANAPKRKVFNDAVDMLTGGEPAAAGKGAVSYTHLTLPTI